jgi:hypothetical protein
VHHLAATHISLVNHTQLSSAHIIWSRRSTRSNSAFPIKIEDRRGMIVTMNVFDMLLDLVAQADVNETVAPPPSVPAHSPPPRTTAPSIENSKYVEAIRHSMNEINRLGLPPCPSRQPTLHTYDEDNNIMNFDARERFKNECIVTDPMPLFSEIFATTNTIGGCLSNVSFHEQDLITELTPDERIVMYRCNFGKLVYEGYSETIKVRTTNRGRKPKKKVVKTRKMQGMGTDFNSQITCLVLGATPPIRYKIKVFRTGKVQLPGVHQLHVDDAIECIQRIVQVLNFHLHPGETDPARLTRVINMNPVMKNYKFVVNLPSAHLLDLRRLRVIFVQERKDSDANAPRHPRIFTVKYTRQDTKLSIKFATPIPHKIKKKTRINIFMRGRINILGAFQFHVTEQLYRYLHWVIDTHYDQVVVPEGMKLMDPMPLNIEQFTEEELGQIIKKYKEWMSALPPLSEQEYITIMRLIDQVYDDIVLGAEVFILEHLSAVVY